MASNATYNALGHTRGLGHAALAEAQQQGNGFAEWAYMCVLSLNMLLFGTTESYSNLVSSLGAKNIPAA